MKKLIIVLIMLATVILPSFAVQIVMTKNLNSFFKQTNARTANATCFMYANNNFKCACRFSSNEIIWQSNTHEYFNKHWNNNGNTLYGYIKECAKD